MKQLKVGDKVKVLGHTPVLSTDSIPDPGWAKAMDEEVGKVFIVDYVGEAGLFLKGNTYDWHPNWLELVEEVQFSKPARDPAVIAECNDKMMQESVDKAHSIGKLEGRSECVSKLYKLGYGEAAAELILALYGKEAA